MNINMVNELLLIGIMTLAVLEVAIIVMAKLCRKKDIGSESDSESEPEPEPESEPEGVVDSSPGSGVKIDSALLRKSDKEKRHQEINNIYVWSREKNVRCCMFCGGENDIDFEICHTCGEKKECKG